MHVCTIDWKSVKFKNAKNAIKIVALPGFGIKIEFISMIRHEEICCVQINFGTQRPFLWLLDYTVQQKLNDAVASFDFAAIKHGDKYHLLYRYVLFETVNRAIESLTTTRS